MESRLACLAKECGLDGVVASPDEIGNIREACGPDFPIVTSDIHPVWASAGDQRHVMRPREAMEAGADYLMLADPFTSPPASVDNSPVRAAQEIAGEISTGLLERIARAKEDYDCLKSVL